MYFCLLVLFFSVFLALWRQVQFQNPIGVNKKYKTRLNKKSEKTPEALLQEQNVPSFLPSWLPQCRAIFLDMGSNLAFHIRYLFEANKYENRSSATYRQFYRRYFGDPAVRQQPSSVSGICAIGFEANRVHKNWLQKLERCFWKKKWNVAFFVPNAVWNVSNAVLDFETQAGDADFNGYWGYRASTLFTEKMREKKDASAKMRENLANQMSVTRKSVNVGVQNGNMDRGVLTTDIVDFVKNVAKKMMPSSSAENKGRKNFIVGKMDIEGGEQVVAPLLDNLCAKSAGGNGFDAIIREFHYSWGLPPRRKPETAESVRGGKKKTTDSEERNCVGPQWINHEESKIPTDELPEECA